MQSFPNVAKSLKRTDKPLLSIHMARNDAPFKLKKNYCTHKYNQDLGLEGVNQEELWFGPLRLWSL